MLKISTTDSEGRKGFWQNVSSSYLAANIWYQENITLLLLPIIR